MRKQTIQLKWAAHINSHFSKEDMKVTNLFMKNYSALVIIWGNVNQIYSSVSLHTSQNGCYQKTDYCKCWKGYGEDGTLAHCWWKCKVPQLWWQTVWRFLRKLKNGAANCSSSLLLDMCPREMKALCGSGTALPCLSQHCSHQPRKLAQPKGPSIDEKIKKTRHEDTV